MILEVCANSYQSAINAQIAGAKRIELCSELSTGGMTPSFGLLKKVSENIPIKVFVLIRPRSGNFTYSDDEFEIMTENIMMCKQLNCSGIASGVLNPDNTIDIERTAELIKLSRPLSFTFHRAFDCVPNPKKALQQLINLGADRILTSGLQKKAIDGLPLLEELQKIAQNKITILAGGGINSSNANDFKRAGIKEIHASASKVITQNNNNDYFGNNTQTVSDVTSIKNILNIVSDA